MDKFEWEDRIPSLIPTPSKLIYKFPMSMDFIDSKNRLFRYSVEGRCLMYLYQIFPYLEFID